MKLEPYALCPCGSGKNLKFCCWNDYPVFAKASEMVVNAQPEGGLRLLKTHVEQHPGNAKLLVYLARLYFSLQQYEESFQTVQEALAKDPTIPSGLFLHGMLLADRGDLPGALVQLRKAAELYSDKQSESLKLVYGLTADLELQRGNYIAGRLALERELINDPGNEERRKLFDNFFGKNQQLPLAVIRPYSFQGPSVERAKAWEEAIGSAPVSKLTAARNAFEKLIASDPGDLPARYNVGLISAWLGDNRRAIDELDAYIDAEPDADKAAFVMGLREAISSVPGCEDACDYLQHKVNFEIVAIEPALKWLEKLRNEGRLKDLEVNREQDYLVLGVFEKSAFIGLDSGETAKPFFAILSIARDFLVIHGPHEENIDRFAAEIETELGTSVKPVFKGHIYGNFLGPVNDAFPVESTGEGPQQNSEQVRDRLATYFEGKWLHKPRKALKGNTPMDAAGDPVLRKRLEGIIQFHLQLVAKVLGVPDTGDYKAMQASVPYSFDRLRRKLGLTATQPVDPNDADALGVPELAEKVKSATDTNILIPLFNAAVRLRAGEVAAEAARRIYEAPEGQEPADRSGYAMAMVQKAMAEDKPGDALSWTEKAIQRATERNQLASVPLLQANRLAALFKLGHYEEAELALVNERDTLLKDAGLAANLCERLLSMGRNQAAADFAEHALNHVRKVGPRDLEGHFQECVKQAKKQLAKA